MLHIDIIEKVNRWLNSTIVDDESKLQIAHLEKNNPKELEESFYTNLEFGTGGLRGIMGVGDNRMNKYTVGKATQGFANYLKKKCVGEIKVIIAFDSRNNSPFFAQTAANVLAANGIKVLLFKELRPTPELSYLLRYFKCSAGIVCTASHNPKEYNGYKAYWSDGAQLTPPHDKAVIAEVDAIPSFDEVKWIDPTKATLITHLGNEVDDIYMDMIIKKIIHPEAILQHKKMKLVYTPIHGTGVTILPQLLKKIGLQEVHLLEAQATPDGNFPTVIYPNPEEKEAMKLGLEKTKQIGAEILIGTDPDSDRIAVAIRNDENELELINGNQLAVLAFNYVMEETAKKQGGKLDASSMVVSTIVSTPMIEVLAKKYQCNFYGVLTGFKWIASLIRDKEHEEKYLIGGEESFGLMWGDEGRDKDAISATVLFCEMAAYEKTQGRTIFQKLLSLYEQHGFYYEHLMSVTKKGIDGKKEIHELMQSLRGFKADSICGIPIVAIKDYKLSTSYSPLTGKTDVIHHLPPSDVLQYLLEDGTLISARPSGTEPKIKFYFSVNFVFDKSKKYQYHVDKALEKIKAIVKEMNLS